MTSNAAKNFNILATNLSSLRNYFVGPIKLFSDLYLTKFLLQQNRIFPCSIHMIGITYSSTFDGAII